MIIGTALRSRPVTGPGSKGEIVAELFETYVAASARTQQYRREGRPPDPELIATDLAESLGFSGSIGRRTNSELTRSVIT